MTNIPQVAAEDMNQEQRRNRANVMATTSHSGSHSIGYTYAPGLWEAANAASAHLADCAPSHHQKRSAALSTSRHWNAAYLLAEQVPMAPDAVTTCEQADNIDDGERPAFEHSEDQTVYYIFVEPLTGGTLCDEACVAAMEILGHARLVDAVSPVGYLYNVFMLANVVAAVPLDTAPVKLKNQDR